MNTHLIRRAFEVYFSKNRDKKMFKSSSNPVKTEKKAISLLLKMCYNMSASWTSFHWASSIGFQRKKQKVGKPLDKKREVSITAYLPEKLGILLIFLT